MNNKLLWVLLIWSTIIGCTIYQVQAYRVLGVLHTEAPSHFITGSALMEGLAEAGHDVTVISPFPDAKQLKKCRTIDIRSDAHLLQSMFFF